MDHNAPSFSSFGLRLGLFEEQDINEGKTATIPFNGPANSVPQQASTSLQDKTSLFEKKFAAADAQNQDVVMDPCHEYSSSVHSSVYGEVADGEASNHELTTKAYFAYLAHRNKRLDPLYAVSSQHFIAPVDHDVMPTIAEDPSAPETQNAITELRNVAVDGIIRNVSHYIHTKWQLRENEAHANGLHHQAAEELAAWRLPKYYQEDVPASLIDVVGYMNMANTAWEEIRDEILATPLRQEYLLEEQAYMARQLPYLQERTARKNWMGLTKNKYCRLWRRFRYWKRNRSNREMARKQEQFEDLEHLSGVLDDVNARFEAVQKQEKYWIRELFDRAVRRQIDTDGNVLILKGMQTMFDRILLSEYREFMTLKLRLEVPESAMMKDENWYLTY